MCLPKDASGRQNSQPLNKIGKYMVLMVMGLVLTACPPNCNSEIRDFGTLPEEALAMVPYQDGESYRFVHSAGQEINFLASRKTTEETEHWDPCGGIIYERNNTNLVPDYPIFNIILSMAKTDTTDWGAQAYLSSVTFPLANTDFYQIDHKFFDSLSIAGEWYRDVYRIKGYKYNSVKENEIFPDSLWYNTEAGILKISMSNGEFYQIVP